MLVPTHRQRSGRPSGWAAFVARRLGEPAGIRTLDLLITSHFGFRRPLGRGSWSGPSLRHIPSPGRRRVPSGLYTFPAGSGLAGGPGLARDRRRRDADGFPEFDTCSPRRFQRGLPYESQLLCRLSYGLTKPSRVSRAVQRHQFKFAARSSCRPFSRRCPSIKTGMHHRYRTCALAGEALPSFLIARASAFTPAAPGTPARTRRCARTTIPI